MAKIEQIYRLLYIAELLKNKKQGISYEETKIFLEDKFREKGLDLKFSEKTFKRDRVLIAEFLGLETQYKKSFGTFTISKDEFEQEKEYDLENILLIEAYRKSKKNSKFILFEKRKPNGLYHFSTFIKAIKGGRVVSLYYHKYTENKPKKRVLVPYAIKEYQNRWYLLATDFSVNNKTNLENFLATRKKPKLEMPKIKSFAFDRISNVEIHHTRQLRYTHLIEDSFVHSFGVSSTIDETPQEIILSFTPHQGKYIKSLPLHHSQEILVENDKELTIKVKLFPTYDFTQEILSHGSNVIVTSPKSYRDEIAKIINEMAEKYK
ncbi:WYL domain-containing protein [Riemerella anatipestifer]|uniref:Uncharacterized protein n=2 Tax=Riemerella anatipestifer TaxID=34085 RepID=E4T9E5_RIEAD|nr:WYL domain-containing protein [Riemerella anatipestifer]ADQ81626.1 hypothetical protein Riean_0458 [Riemerella anatipestifer ATCC 11845 = DSM 15868]ADZ12879.1 hypothetical protein RIA_1815 [Riemerella anatipestifer RA-GD]AFD55640.1 hypothetical protein RA0C_0680 [Riemerella anatipestifer ATCC 11845 = DSM 15868]AGC40466.1 hypothetical protein G148_1162 [Riemerella anatipestifer RA-CH-2]AKP68885.1 hypothetical protein CG08_0508 [Riemerella anatipestifer]